jgi:hypothetical protein
MVSCYMSAPGGGCCRGVVVCRTMEEGHTLLTAPMHCNAMPLPDASAAPGCCDSRGSCLLLHASHTSYEASLLATANNLCAVA